MYMYRMLFSLCFLWVWFLPVILKVSDYQKRVWQEVGGFPPIFLNVHVHNVLWFGFEGWFEYVVFLDGRRVSPRPHQGSQSQ